MIHRRTFLKLAASSSTTLVAFRAQQEAENAVAAESVEGTQAPFRLAVETSMFRRFPPAETWGMIHRAGYRFVELAAPHFRAADASPETVAELRKEWTNAGLTALCAFVVHPISSPDESRRREAVERWRRSLETVSRLGLKLVSTELTGELARPKESEAAFRKSLDVLLPQFEQAGIVLSVEPHPGDFYEAAGPTLKLLRSYRSKHLTYLHCIPHTFFLGDSMREVIGEAGELATHVHVADTFRAERIMARAGVGLHLHLRPGLGEVDFRQTFDALAAAGYRGAVSVQLLSHADQPEQAARQARDYLQELLGSRLMV